MDYYYGHAEGNFIALSGEEFNHLKNVKRIRHGDTFFATDGAGNLFTGSYRGPDSLPEIVKKETFAPKKFSLHIAVAPTKNIDRIEWFLEKAVETGIDEVSFLLCRHSERKEIRLDRMLRIAISALKQSQKVFLPKIHDMISFEDFIANNFSGNKLLFTQTAGEGAGLKKNYEASNNLVALIGPEGDFHESESKLAISKGFVPTSLGDSRLRTETAALAVCTLFNFINAQ